MRETKLVKLAKQVSELLHNSSPVMTFEELADQLGLSEEELFDKLTPVRKKLAQNHTPTILVTEVYIKLKREPANRLEAMKSCALHGRRAVALRLQWMDRNDLLGIMWTKLNQTNSSGIQSSNFDRITVGHVTKKLTKAKAQALVDEIGIPRLPFHETEFKALMGKKKK